ncbi:hypothetical protein ACFYPW_00005, partial [Micromonospora zamorensis]|uniref:hypothetical protein n=1 Tax=Micromonospora zamorensis TaxID=709883 RepID=UPI0036B1FBAB
MRDVTSGVAINLRAVGVSPGAAAITAVGDVHRLRRLPIRPWNGAVRRPAISREPIKRRTVRRRLMRDVTSGVAINLRAIGVSPGAAAITAVGD